MVQQYLFMNFCMLDGTIMLIDITGLHNDTMEISNRVSIFISLGIMPVIVKFTKLSFGTNFASQRKDSFL